MYRDFFPGLLKHSHPMVCKGCNQETWAVKTIFSRNGQFESCALCGGVSSVYFPDVYFKDAGLEPNLSDEKHPEGYFISSKRQKAAVMKKLGVRESGDRMSGSRNEEYRRHWNEYKKHWR